jgi:low temperature requirement protein LtrA
MDELKLSESEVSLLPDVNPWWQPPRLRSAVLDGESRHPTWLELFFDLILVAAIGQLGKTLDHDLNWLGLFRFLFLAIPIWWAWTGVTFYTTRFDTNDLSDRIFYFSQMVCVAGMAISVQDAFGAYSVGFAMSYGILRLLLVCQYILAAIYVPESRPLTLRYATGFGLSAICFLASVWVPDPQRFLVWGMALVLDFSFPMSAGKLHALLPPHNAHISERYGLFIMVVLGEAVSAAVIGISDMPKWTVYAALSGFFGLLVTFSLWWMYFDHASNAPMRSVEATGSVLLYQTWLYSHLPLMIGLSAMGVAIEQLVLAAPTQPLPDMLKWLLCLSVALSLLVVGVVHTISCYCGAQQIRRILVPYVIVIVAIFLMAALWPIPMPPYMWGLSLCALCLLNLVVLVSYDRRIYNAQCKL